MRRDAVYWRNLGCFALILSGLAVAVVVLGLAWWQADAFLHPARRLPAETPADRGLEYRDVEFPSTDGITLRGWYLPSENGAAIIAGHGIGGNRLLEPAEMLSRHLSLIHI